MSKSPDSKYDLEDRTFEFARDITAFISQVPKSLTNIEVCRQLIRSGGSIGANYIEANESLGKKDFRMRIKICRKESKEARYWLRLVDCDSDLEEKRVSLVREATELMKIFGSILEKSK
jgi:four helix bundle protein